MRWSTWGVFLSETPVGFLISRTSFPLPNRPPTDAKSQENTVPATEAASATVEDVGSGLVGDFVARWWITWFLFVEVWFVNNTFERVDWLPLATPSSQDEICQEDFSMTRQSGISTKQR